MVMLIVVYWTQFGKMMKKVIVANVIGMLFSATLVANAAGDDIIGVWIDDSQEAKTEFFKCEDGTYVAKLVWTVKDKGDKPLKDRKNPDKSLRDNPLVGTVVMKQMTYDSAKKQWDMPWAYDPSWGMTGSGYIRLNEEGQLVVKGSKWGITVTRILTRVDE